MCISKTEVKTMYEIKTNDNSLNIQCAASFQEAEMMCEDVDQFVENSKILREYKFTIILGLREMVNNALAYGSENTETSQIHMKLVYNDQKLKMMMKDEGEGFNWKKQKVKDIKPLEVGGKGLYLLEKYFDCVYFNDKGNLITVEKFLGEEKNN